MGLLSSLASIAAPIAGTIFGGPVGGAIGGAVGGLLGSRDTPSSMTATNQQKIDPRMDTMLWGKDGQGGLLSQYQAYLNQPQSQALQNYGKSAGDYLNNNGAADMGAIRNAATGLLGGASAPLVSATTASIPSYAVGSQVQAPAQNSMDLTGSYNSLINGPAGANPYLTGAIQKGINQSTNAFGNMLTDAKAATQDVLGSVRGNSVLAGQYGGSRQGLAEGKAIDSMNTNLARAAAQFGQNNTDAAVAAQAGAYDADRNRQLAATQGLGAQQYATAFQNANTANQAEFMNVQNQLDVSKYNAGLGQQANLANQQAQLGMNGQNNSAALGGAGLLGGLASQAYGTAQNADNAGINRATQVNNLLTPYLGANRSSTDTQPLYQNQANNVAGGLLGGLQMSGLLGGGSTTSGGATKGGLLDLFGSTFGSYGGKF